MAGAAAAAEGVSEGIKATLGYLAEKKKAKAEKKEKKRKTRSDFLLGLLKERLETAQKGRETQQRASESRAATRESRAEAFRKALLG